MTPTPQPPENTYESAFLRGLQPDPAFTISDWADQNRWLTPRSSPEPGKWRTTRTPYLREIMDSLSPQSRVETVVFMAGAQLGKTESGNNWIGYNIHVAPGPMMCVQPTTEMAKRNSKQRIGPLIEDCAVLRRLVKPARSRDSGNTVLSKEFPGGILVMVGANSGKGLRSMSARYLFLDEVDGYPGDVEGEGEPCDLAIARTRNYARRKIFITSTPVVSGRSRIERFFADTDQCHYYVPCPMCEHMQVLKFENLHWTPGEPQTVTYSCEACESKIPDHAKDWMLPRGEWRPHAKGDGRTRGFHLSSLYSPVGWLSWPQIVEKYEKAGNDREKLQVFWNTILGLPWADRGELPDVDRLFERCEDYTIGVVPDGGLVLTAGVDVQLRRIECEIVAWGRDRQSWSVDYRVFHGDTNQPEVWKQVEALLDEDFATVYGGKARISRMGVDTGFNTLQVYSFVRRMKSQRIMAVKGNARSPALVNHPNPIEVGPQGRRVYDGLKLWPVNVSLAKEELYRWLRLSVPDIDAGEAWPTGYCHFPQYSKDFFQQLCAEQLITRVVRGRQVTAWEKIHDRNEALDCRILARAAASSMRLETWHADKWAQREKELSKDRPPEQPPAPAARPVVQTTARVAPEFKAFPMKDSFSE